MAQGYAGVPAGPLSAYLGVREGNRQAGLEELQGATQIQGMLARAQAQQKQAAYQQEIAQADTPEKQAQVALKYGGPEGAMRHLDRQTQIAANKEAIRGRLQLQEQMNDFRHQDTMRRAANDTERIAETARRNREKADFDRQMLELRGELGREGLDIKRAAAEQAKKNSLDKNVQQLGTALERANLPQSHSVLSGVEQALEKTPGLAEYISGAKSFISSISLAMLSINFLHHIKCRM